MGGVLEGARKSAQLLALIHGRHLCCLFTWQRPNSNSCTWHNNDLRSSSGWRRGSGQVRRSSMGAILTRDVSGAACHQKVSETAKSKSREHIVLLQLRSLCEQFN